MRAIAILLVLALLGVYVAITLVMGAGSLEGDEVRYAFYADSLTKGTYAPPQLKVLWNGPGYPLVLAPLAALHAPWIWGKLLNPLFILGSAALVYLLLCIYLSRPLATARALIAALYPPILIYMPRLLTESLSVFFVAGFCFATARYFAGRQKRYCWLAGIFCGFLILTKVMFAYVALAALAVAVLLRFFKRPAGRMVEIYAIAFLVCLPWLFYTWSLTGKVFYWSNSGGSSLYCMSVHTDSGYGDWSVIFGPQGRAEHSDLLARLEKLDYVERDALLKREAISRIKSDPTTYLTNLVSNVGRLWYNYPYANKLQRPQTLVITVPNSMLLLSLLACLYPIVAYRKRIPPELGSLMLFAAIYLVGASLVFACDRYLVPVFPILLVTVLFTATRLLSIRPANSHR